MKQGKVWGMTDEMFSTGNVSVHLLHIEAGGYSSEHLHDAKSNLFYVIEGKVEISQWANADAIDKTVLSAGESTTILPGIWHKFQAFERSVVVEIYELRFRGEDIVRRSQGGR